MQVSIIIPSYNRNDLLNTCIQSILKNTTIEFEIIVVNDYKIKPIVLNNINNGNIKIINNPKQGVASARNLGASLAKSEILIFIDDDMLINDYAIDKAYNYISKNTNHTYNVDWIYPPEINKEFIKSQFGNYINEIHFNSYEGWNRDVIKNWERNTILFSKGITSQFFAISKKLFNDFDGYDESYPSAGFEDFDLSERLKKSKLISFAIDTSVLLYHNELDRLNPRNFLLRRRNGSISRKVAVNNGYNELIINYGILKKIIFKTCSAFENMLLNFIQLIPNKSPFKIIYKKMMNFMIALNIYIGYNTK